MGIPERISAGYMPGKLNEDNRDSLSIPHSLTGKIRCMRIGDSISVNSHWNRSSNPPASYVVLNRDQSGD